MMVCELPKSRNPSIEIRNKPEIEKSKRVPPEISDDVNRTAGAWLRTFAYVVLAICAGLFGSTIISQAR